MVKNLLVLLPVHHPWSSALEYPSPPPCATSPRVPPVPLFHLFFQFVILADLIWRMSQILLVSRSLSTTLSELDRITVSLFLLLVLFLFILAVTLSSSSPNLYVYVSLGMSLFIGRIKAFSLCKEQIGSKTQVHR